MQNARGTLHEWGISFKNLDKIRLLIGVWKPCANIRILNNSSIIEEVKEC